MNITDYLNEDIKTKIENQFPEGSESFQNRQLGAFYGYSLAYPKIQALQGMLDGVEEENKTLKIKLAGYKHKLNVLANKAKECSDTIEQLKKFYQNNYQ